MNCDERYFNAVEANDTELLREMVGEAAKAAGYRIGPVYHGTRALDAFTVFDGSKGSSQNEFWFSDDVEGSSGFVGTPPGRVIEAFLKIERPGNPLHLIEVRTGRSKDFDGVVYSGQFKGAGSGTGNAYVVFSPNQIKSAAAVERDDAGEVIPLSRRFTDSPDMRGSVTTISSLAQTHSKESVISFPGAQSQVRGASKGNGYGR